LNVDVVYTELDIRSKTPSNSQKEAVAAQAWARVAQSCINVQRCVGMTIWVSATVDDSELIWANGLRL
jgi:endo-1,4-beta-xylanase